MKEHPAQKPLPFAELSRVRTRVAAIDQKGRRVVPASVGTIVDVNGASSGPCYTVEIPLLDERVIASDSHLLELEQDQLELVAPPPMNLLAPYGRDRSVARRGESLVFVAIVLLLLLAGTYLLGRWLQLSDDTTLLAPSRRW